MKARVFFALGLLLATGTLTTACTNDTASEDELYEQQQEQQAIDRDEVKNEDT
jgi:hypothetical protein